MFTRVLIGFDGSDGSLKALRAGLHLAKTERAECTALTVIELPRFAAGAPSETKDEIEGATAHVAKLHEQARAEASREGVKLDLESRIGHAAHDLVTFAKHGRYDLLVLGHKGHSGVWGLFLGTTADKIVRHATCSVVVIR